MLFYSQRYNPGIYEAQYKCPGCKTIYYNNGELADHLLDVPDCQEVAGLPETWGTHLHEFRLMTYATPRQRSIDIVGIDSNINMLSRAVR